MAYFITQPRVLYVLQVDDAKHRDKLKIGEIFADSADVQEYEDAGMLADFIADRLRQTSWGKDLKFKVLLALRTTYESADGPARFKARDIIDILENSGYEPEYLRAKKTDLWMPVTLKQIEEAIEARKLGELTIEGKPKPAPKAIDFRPEQEESIRGAKDKFSQKTGKKYLWNAKMRFGKTLSALELANRLGVKTTLIVTHRPVVDSGWEDDFNKIFYTPEQQDLYSYGRRNLGHKDNKGDFYSLTKDVEEKGKRLVFFVSMQYLRLSDIVGGDNKSQLKRDIMNYPWDLVVVDEAHEGTKTLRGQNVLEKLKKDNTLMLSLSGTPFNLYDDFKDEEIFTWDYVREQSSKARWDEEHFGDPNPYADLPHMNLFTFDLSKIMANNEEDSEFNFKEFFRVWTGDKKKDHGEEVPAGSAVGRFVHEAEVNAFLTELSNPGNENYPFSTGEFQRKFRHTFWMVPGVKEAAALEELLGRHPIFGRDENGKRRFEVANVAGDGNTEDVSGEALEKVRKTIRENDYSITLSCGKLTTGVSVPEWTAVLYLKGSEMTTAATYMQTIFRVQTHAVIDGEQKRECYVFDFAPTRALRVVAETAKMATRGKGSGSKGFVKGPREDEEDELGEFLKFCPVVALDGGKMTPYEPSKLYAQLKDVYVARAVQSGYADNSLYSPESIIHLDDEALAALDEARRNIGSTPNLPPASDINVGYKPMTGKEIAAARRGEKNKREKKPLTPEQEAALKKKKEEREEKKARISVLRGISIRIPLLIYGAEIDDDEEDIKLSIENFTRLVDNASWEEFMPDGVTKEMFNKLRKSYDPTVFREAAKRIRSLTRAADSMDVEERIERISTIFSYFHNPDKETVLTPWRVVNMHMADTLGGWSFYNSDFTAPNIEVLHENGLDLEVRRPRFVDRGEVTKTVFAPNSRILEINSKTGLYPLYVTYSLYRAWRPEYDLFDLIDKPEQDDKVVWDQILKENVFVICKTPMARAITRRTLVGFRRQDDGSDIQVNAVCPYWTVPLTDLPKKEREKHPNQDTVKLDLVNVLRFKPGLFERDSVMPRWWETVDKKAKIKLDKKIFHDMIKFSAVVGNPPYQIMDGGDGGSALPVYNLFVLGAQNLNPSVVSMIMPARWYAGGRNLDEFRDKILSQKRISKIVDFVDSRDIFPSVQIKGGISYFIINSSTIEKCVVENWKGNQLKSQSRRPLLEEGCDFFIRHNDAISILHKVNIQKSFSELVSNMRPFGLRTYFNDFSTTPFEGSIKIFANGGYGYIDPSIITINKDYIQKYKIFISRAYGAGEDFPHQILNKPIIGGNKSCCTETYLAIGPFSNESEENLTFKYIKTRFFRFMVMLRKNTQDAPSRVYGLVPHINEVQDIDWNKSVAEIDQQLYAKYGLDEKEIAFIESMIKPMS